MSFFAGNGKLHITSNQRNVTELNTDTIYPDTVFHSNMQSLCSLGEYQVQSAAVGFHVNSSYEECFEAAIPAAVQSALLDNKVVLVIMGNIQKERGNQTPYETLLGLPINIKVGTGAGTSGNNITYSVAVAPQVTAGGMLDVSYSVNSINARTITVVGKDEWGTTGKFEPSDKVLGWSTDPDYSAGGKVTNLLRPTSKYVQYHARGLRWKLSNYETRVHNIGDLGVDDNPYLENTAAILAPNFTFIVLNARFVNGSYQFINPLTPVNNDGIVMQGNNITVKGAQINSIKILQSKNIYAQGPFIVGQALNRIPPGLSVSNAGIYSGVARQYKQWAMVNFMQGAKHPNGTLAFMPNPGACEQLLILKGNNNANYSMVDLPYTAHVCPSGPSSSQWLNIWGYPMPGFFNSHNTSYKRRRDTLLFASSPSMKVLGYMSQHDPFALLDTKAFTSLYITKDGISGNFAGRVLPIWNTQSPPTHMMLGTMNLSLGSSSITRSDLLSNNLVTVEVPGSSVYMGFNREEESILLGVKATNANVGTNFHLPPGTNGYQDNMCITFEVAKLSGMYTGDGVVHSLHKLFDGEEIVIAQSYMQGSVKNFDYQGVTGGGSHGDDRTLNQAMILQTIGIHILYCLKREGNSLRRYTRVMINADLYTRIWGDATLEAIDWSLSTINIPSVSAYVVRIQ